MILGGQFYINRYKIQRPRVDKVIAGKVCDYHKKPGHCRHKMLQLFYLENMPKTRRYRLQRVLTREEYFGIIFAFLSSLIP